MMTEKQYNAMLQVMDSIANGSNIDEDAKKVFLSIKANVEDNTKTYTEAELKIRGYIEAHGKEYIVTDNASYWLFIDDHNSLCADKKGDGVNRVLFDDMTEHDKYRYYRDLLDTHPEECEEAYVSYNDTCIFGETFDQYIVEVKNYDEYENLDGTYWGDAESFVKELGKDEMVGFDSMEEAADTMQEEFGRCMEDCFVNESLGYGRTFKAVPHQVDGCLINGIDVFYDNWLRCSFKVIKLDC